MGLTNAARDLISTGIVTGTISPAFNNANSAIGVGDSSTAFVNTQTNLIAVTNGFRKAMDATYPQQATNVLTFRATFALADANFAWNEWGVFNAIGTGSPPTGGTMLNRKQEALGTKASTQSWQFTVTLTMTAA